MSSANRVYVLNDKNQIVLADENGVAQPEAPVDNGSTHHLQTPPPQQADQPNVFFANAGKNNAYNATGAAFFNDKQPTYETYEAYLKAQSSAQAAHNHQLKQQQQQQQHHYQQQQPQHHVQHQQVQTQRHHPSPQVVHTQAQPPSKPGCTACKDCPNKVLPATITFVNHVPETPIYPESQLKESADSALLKQYYYAQPPPIQTQVAPTPVSHHPTPVSHHQTPQPATPHHHSQPQASPVQTRVVKTKQVATVAPPPPPATVPASQPQQVYYYPIPHPPAHKQHHAPAPAPVVQQVPAPKPCTACKQAPAPAPVAQPKQVAPPVYYAHQKPAPYYSTLPSSVGKQAHPLAHYVPAPIVAPAHIQAQHPPVHHTVKSQIIRQKSSGNLLRHQPITNVAPSVEKHAHHHYQPLESHHHHLKQAAVPSPAPKSNCTSCKHSGQAPSRASGSLNRAETVGCLPCMQKKLQMEAQIRAQIEAQEAADLAAKIRSLQTTSNQVKIQQAQKA